MTPAPQVEAMLPDLRTCGDQPERGVPKRVRKFLEQVREHLTELHRALEGHADQMIEGPHTLKVRLAPRRHRG